MVSTLSLVLLLTLGQPAPAASSKPAGLAEELRRARDDEAPLDDRLAAARRAHGIAATAETAALLKATFLDVERDWLAHVGSFERLRASCPSPDAMPIAVDGCVRELLARSSAQAALVDVQGDEVVSVALGADQATLQAVHGVVRRALQQRGRLQLDVELVRARMPRDAALERAILTALPPAPRAVAFVGPVLSKTSREALAALPASLVELDGAPGHRVIPERCRAAPSARALELSWLGQAQLAYTSGAETSREAMFDAWRVERGVELALTGKKTVRVVWPTAEKDVIELDGVGWGTSDAFPRRPALDCPK